VRNPFLLIQTGIVLVVLAIIFDAMAYKKREVERKSRQRAGHHKISIACGILMGTFYPLIVKATTG